MCKHVITSKSFLYLQRHIFSGFAYLYGSVNNPDACDLRYYGAHYNVTVMQNHYTSFDDPLPVDQKSTVKRISCRYFIKPKGTSFSFAGMNPEPHLLKSCWKGFRVAILEDTDWLCVNVGLKRANITYDYGALSQFKSFAMIEYLHACYQTGKNVNWLKFNHSDTNYKRIIPKRVFTHKVYHRCVNHTTCSNTTVNSIYVHLMERYVDVNQINC